MRCSCGNRADVKVPDGPYLCVQCYATFQRTIQESQRLNFAYLNFLQDEMGFISGLGRIGPRIRVPMPTYIDKAPITMNTTNHIKVEAGSTVGQINAGAINYLDHAVMTFNGAGLTEAATALQSFSQLVVDSQELSAETQHEILDLLRAMVAEVHKPKQERNQSLFRLALQRIGPLVNACTAIAGYWDHLKKLLEQMMGR